jgi:hypothetical protein
LYSVAIKLLLRIPKPSYALFDKNYLAKKSGFIILLFLSGWQSCVEWREGFYSDKDIKQKKTKFA